MYISVLFKLKTMAYVIVLFDSVVSHYRYYPARDVIFRLVPLQPYVTKMPFGNYI